MGGYTVEIPEEPADRTVVLDRDTWAWQRCGEVWERVGRLAVPSIGVGGEAFLGCAISWAHLLLDHGPLTPLITADDCDTPDWQAAGFTGPDLERYAQPEGVERVDAPGLEDETAPTVELTDDQRDDALATHGQAIDYRGIDQRVIGLKHAAGACASTWQLTDDPDGGVTSRVTRAYPAGDEG